MIPPRKQPVRSWENLTIGSLIAVPAILLIIFGTMLVAIDQEPWPIILPGGIGAVLGGIMLRKGLVTIQYRHMLRKSEAIAAAEILNRETIDYPGTTEGAFPWTVYWINVSFIPLESSSWTSQVTYTAQVNRKVFNLLKDVNAIMVKYCREDPQIFMLEGEN